MRRARLSLARSSDSWRSAATGSAAKRPREQQEEYLGTADASSIVSADTASAAPARAPAEWASRTAERAGGASHAPAPLPAPVHVPDHDKGDEVTMEGDAAARFLRSDNERAELVRPSARSRPGGERRRQQEELRYRPAVGVGSSGGARYGGEMSVASEDTQTGQERTSMHLVIEYRDTAIDRYHWQDGTWHTSVN